MCYLKTLASSHVVSPSDLFFALCIFLISTGKIINKSSYKCHSHEWTDNDANDSTNWETCRARLWCLKSSLGPGMCFVVTDFLSFDGIYDWVLISWINASNVLNNHFILNHVIRLNEIEHNAGWKSSNLPWFPILNIPKLNFSQKRSLFVDGFFASHCSYFGLIPAGTWFGSDKWLISKSSIGNRRKFSPRNFSIVFRKTKLKALKELSHRPVCTYTFHYIGKLCSLCYHQLFRL